MSETRSIKPTLSPGLNRREEIAVRLAEALIATGKIDGGTKIVTLAVGMTDLLIKELESETRSKEPNERA